VQQDATIQYYNTQTCLVTRPSDDMNITQVPTERRGQSARKCVWRDSTGSSRGFRKERGRMVLWDLCENFISSITTANIKKKMVLARKSFLGKQTENDMSNLRSCVCGSVTNNNGFKIGWLGLLTTKHLLEISPVPKICMAFNKRLKQSAIILTSQEYIVTRMTDYRQDLDW
jgi:hypothetical protein